MKHPAHDRAYVDPLPDGADFPKGKLGWRPSKEPHWTEGLQRDPRGALISNAANIDWALAECPALWGLFWWEQLHKRVWIIGSLPTQSWLVTEEWRPLTHDDVTALLVYFQRDLMLTGTDRRLLYWAIRKVAKEHQFRLDDDDNYTVPERD